jgi:hypothetical protein
MKFEGAVQFSFFKHLFLECLLTKGKELNNTSFLFFFVGEGGLGWMKSDFHYRQGI